MHGKHAVAHASKGIRKLKSAAAIHASHKGIGTDGEELDVMALPIQYGARLRSDGILVVLVLVPYIVPLLVDRGDAEHCMILLVPHCLHGVGRVISRG